MIESESSDLRQQLKLDLNRIGSSDKRKQREAILAFRDNFHDHSRSQSNGSPVTPKYGARSSIRSPAYLQNQIPEEKVDGENSQIQDQAQKIKEKLGEKLRQMMVKRESEMKINVPNHKKCKKEKKKCICVECGGVLPQQDTPRTKKRKKKAKRLAEKKAKQQKPASLVSSLLKNFKFCPPQFHMLMGILCGGNEVIQDEKISYKKLMKHISNKHPLDPYLNQPFNFSDSITVKHYLPKLFDPFGCINIIHKCRGYKRRLFKQCFKEKKKKLEKPLSMMDMPDDDSDESSSDGAQKGLTDTAVHLGIGPVLYLQIMKTMMILMFLLSILNIPIFILYSNANEVSIIQSIQSYKWSKLTLGSLGNIKHVCQHSHVGLEEYEQQYSTIKDQSFGFNKIQKTYPKKMIFECDNKYGSINQLQSFGFLYMLDLSIQDYSSGEHSCAKINGNEKNILEHSHAHESDSVLTKALMDPNMLPNTTENNIDDQICNYHSMFKSDVDREVFYLMFKQKCLFKNSCEIDLENILVNVTESKIIKQEWFESESMTFKMSKMISEACYKRIFKQNIVSNEMIGVVGCTNDKIIIEQFGFALHKQKIGLIVVFVDCLSVLLMYYIFSRLNPMIDEYLAIIDNYDVKYKNFSFQIKDFILDGQTQDHRIIKMKIWVHLNQLLSKIKTESGDPLEMVDIQLSWSKKSKHLLLYRMEDCEKKIKELNDGIASGEFGPYQTFQAYKEIEKNNEKINRLKEKFNEQMADELKKAHNPSLVPKQLHQKSLEYVYVTLRSNSDIKTVLSMFQIETGASRLIRKMCCIEDEIKDNIKMEEHQLAIQPTVEPDQINWYNMEITLNDRRFRLIIKILIVMFVIIGTVTITSLLKRAQQNYSTPICNAEQYYTAEDAYIQQKQLMIFEAKKLQRVQTTISWDVAYQEVYDSVELNQILSNEMQCYCQQLTQGMLQIWRVTGVNFKDYDEDNSDVNNYCFMWFKRNILSLFINNFAEGVVVVLNALLAYLFEWLSVFLRYRYKTEEQLSAFQLTVFMEFFNMGIIILLMSFDPTGIVSRIMGGNSKLFNGFDSLWYTERGQTICMTIFLSALTTNIPEVKQFVQAQAKRLADRRFRPNLKKDPEDEDDDEVNTSKKLQNQVEELYTGDEWKGAKTISRLISSTMVITSYSSGMPILYVVGFFFFMVTYLVNKLVLIKHLQKVMTINRELPLQVLRLFNTTIVMHLFFGCFMVTNFVIFQTRDKPSDELFVMPTIPIDPKAEVEKLVGVNEQQIQQSSSNTTNLNDTLSGTSQTKIPDHLNVGEMTLEYFLRSISHFHQQIYITFAIVFVTMLYGGEMIKSTFLTILTLCWDFLKFVVYLIVKLITQNVKLLKRKCASISFSFSRSNEKIVVQNTTEPNYSTNVTEMNILDQHGHDGNESSEGQEAQIAPLEIQQNLQDLPKFVAKNWTKFDKDGLDKINEDQAFQLAIEYIEFAQSSTQINRQKFKALFEKQDEEKSGFLTKENVIQLLVKLERSENPSYQTSYKSSQQNSASRRGKEGGQNDSTTQIASQQLRQKKSQSIDQAPKINLNDSLQNDDGQLANTVNVQQDGNTEANLAMPQQMSPEAKELIEKFSSAFSQGYSQGRDHEIGETQGAPVHVLTEEEQKRNEKMAKKYRKLMQCPCYSENIYYDLSITGLRMFYQKAQSELHDVFKLFKIYNPQDEVHAFTPPISQKINKFDVRVHFEELCYQCRLTQHEGKSYIQFLKKRIKDIEQAIDHHFEMIKEVIRQDKVDKFERQMKKDEEEKQKQEKSRKEANGLLNMSRGGTPAISQRSMISHATANKSNRSQVGGQEVPNRIQEQMRQQYKDKVLRETLDADPDLRFDDPSVCTYDKKLKQLYEFEDELLLKDRTQKENRRGVQTICRMKGSISQSYFLFDSDTLNLARDIYYNLVDAGNDYENLNLHPQPTTLDHSMNDSGQVDGLGELKVIKSPRWGQGQGLENQTLAGNKKK